VGIKTFYVGGPCNGHHDEWKGAGPPPLATKCGSPRRVDYVVHIPWSDGGRWVYVVKGGRNDVATETEVAGRRDVFVAFRRLMRALSTDTPRQLGRVARAGKRARRAVR
jgi:hypothetical protein